MPMLVNGVWDDTADHSSTRDGRFVRPESKFRDWISRDGSTGFKAEANRYHLYVSNSCPWAHRTLIFRMLKGLEGIVGVSIATATQKDRGWTFTDEPGCIPDSVNGKDYLHEIYTLANANATGRPTVPIVWDKKLGTIVSNESSEIIRMFNSAFSDVVPETTDYYPQHLRAEIDAINKTIYKNLNNGVYQTGFATSQQVYEEWVARVFSALDMLEGKLDSRRYLCGDQITEADWRLFVTLVRFDLAYYVHFKCCNRHLYEYPNLWNYTLELYQHPGIAQVTNFEHIKLGYFHAMHAINPTKIIAVTPQVINFKQMHNRERLPVN